MRSVLSWLGLFLLAASFVWFVHLPAPAYPAAKPRGTSARTERPLVVLDPGHGGQDSGAMCGTIMEKDLTLDVALRAELLLRAQGYPTVLTRADDRYLSLAERAAVGNNAEDSLFVSIHFNDGEHATASGVETYYALRQSTDGIGLFSWWPLWKLSGPISLGAKSEELARSIQTALIERTRALNRGIKSEQFYVIARARHPAALVEGGFITNKSDATKLMTTEYRQQIALAISHGVDRYRQAARPVKPTVAVAGVRPE